MNKGLLVSTAVGILLVNGATSAWAQTDRNEDDTWDGPGYYVESSTTESNGTQDLFKYGGPFASIDECQEYLQQLRQRVQNVPLSCTYRGSSVQYDACFLTTACVAHAGLGDTCDELTLMRKLRDRYLCRFNEGRLMIDQYYRTSPLILERIESARDRDRVFSWILSEVRRAAQSVARGEFEDATARYGGMVLRLQNRYGVAAGGHLLLPST